jgi:alanyl-tRNA synthetase
MMTGLAEIRATFLDFFKRQGHEVIKSSSLVPNNDPTLMFTNSGMVQFKNVFTGLEKRDYNSATTSQKCLRAGGKHNDLDNVGYTARHHTFFEMLGNFSFGHYFKEEAIPLAWDLVTKEFGLPKEKLLVTVYHTDEEAAKIWKNYAGLSNSQIIKIKSGDNFWSMGPTGPCGPCSEIFFDHGPSVQGGPPGSPNEDGDRYVEIWNLVFMQYDRLENGNQVDLPKPSIDTGMGLERMGAVLQGTHDNFNTDLMRALIEESANLSSQKTDGDMNVHHRVIADHIRSISFLIAEGIFPSNEGRGYVLRRIMRRAMRHAHFLGMREPMMHKMVEALNREMGAAFPELMEARELIEDSLLNEEIKFKDTLERGLKLLDVELSRLKEGNKVSGDVAFKLYDTYGFPLDLTQDTLREKSFEVDLPGFQKAMELQKQKARQAWSGSGDKKFELIWFDLEHQLGASEFLGYNSTVSQAKILALVVKGIKQNQVSQNDLVDVVFNQTPFYGESGGQVTDKGKIFNGLMEGVVESVQKVGNLLVHKVLILSGKISVGDLADLEVDPVRREAIASNHSATHLMHQALKDTLGPHVNQRGSINDHEKIRFDFSHNSPLTADEIILVEDIVNKKILQDSIVSTRLMDLTEAKKLGAQALFGEKYADEVRVVSIGYKDDANLKNGKKIRYSMELCGGTHVERTGMIGSFVIRSEVSSSSGVRRIEALTGLNALRYIQVNRRSIYDLATLLKTPISKISDRIKALSAEKRLLQEQLAQLKSSSGSASALKQADKRTKEIHGVKLIINILDAFQIKDMRALTDDQKNVSNSAVIVNLSKDGDKVSYTVGVTPNLCEIISAVDIIKEISGLTNGKGGGRSDFAQGGGLGGDKVDQIVERIEKFLREAII